MGGCSVDWFAVIGLVPLAAIKLTNREKDYAGVGDLARRPALAAIASGRDALEEALDRERRALMRAHEARLQGYQDAARPWAAAWSAAQRRTAGLPLREAHAELVKLAEGVLPLRPAIPLPLGDGGGHQGDDHS